MLKCLLFFLFAFLIVSSFSFAKDNEPELQKEFGHDLTHVPFFLRFAFNKEFNKDWKKSDYPERKAFLTKYEANVAAEQVKEEAEQKAEAEREKERLREKNEAQHKADERLKASLAEEKSEKDADDERQKEFDKGLQTQQRELDDMRRQALQGQ